MGGGRHCCLHSWACLSGVLHDLSVFSIKPARAETVTPLSVLSLSCHALSAPFVCRNLPGVEVSSVERLNLLQLAPGGHMGRFVIFTKSAFDSLDKIFGE